MHACEGKGERILLSYDIASNNYLWVDLDGGASIERLNNDVIMTSDDDGHRDSAHPVRVPEPVLALSSIKPSPFYF